MRYIGQSADCYKRMGDHIYDIGSGSHKNKRIRRAYLECQCLPICSIIEQCSLESLNSREIYWVAYYNTFYAGLNLTRGGGYARKSTGIKLTYSGIKDPYWVLLFPFIIIIMLYYLC